MKKILSLILCLALVGAMLISCGGDFEPGTYLPNYDYKPEVIEDLTLELYLITEAETTENAKTTVNQMVNQYLDTKQLHTTVNIHFYTEAEYEENAKNAVNNNRANIVLITSPSIFG